MSPAPLRKWEARWAPVLVVLVIVIMGQDVCDAARKNNPLIGDDRDGRRQNTRAAECVFGKQTHELGSSWFADLGPPFGVMHCIRCECLAVHRKRRVVARVQCRNIKDECPIPSCPEPVLLPGRCCKTCEDNIDSPDVVREPAPFITEEEEKNMKNFGALLTGRTSSILSSSTGTPSSSSNLRANVVASARLTFTKRSLFYSIYASGSGLSTLSNARPRAVQFMDRNGSIVEEQTVKPSGSIYQNTTGKVCGVWRRIGREYRRQLRDGKLYVAVLWEDGIAVAGRVHRFRSLSSELYSVLLEPAAIEGTLMDGAGGMAIVSASTTSPSIHVAILFNGVFAADETADAPVNIRLESQDHQHVVLEETVRIHSPNSELNELEVRTAVSMADLRLLTRGKMALSVTSRREPSQLALRGNVGPRASCDIFQAPLTASDTDTEGDIDDNTAIVPNRANIPITGQAWMFIGQDGSLVYNIQITNMQSEGTVVLTLVNGRGRRRVELEDFSPALRVQGNSMWANGTLSPLSPREVEQLYAGELSVNVATASSSSVVRGRLLPRIVADALDTPQPLLFQRPEGVTNSLGGMVWVSVNNDCELHYDLMLSGLPAPRPMQLYLEQVPFIAQGAPTSNRMLENFDDSHLSDGPATPLDPSELSRIFSGVTHFLIRDSSSRATLLSAAFRQVEVPLLCLPNQPTNEVPWMLLDGNNAGGSGGPDASPETLACYDGSRFYEDGVQWISPNNLCSMCNCRRGKVQCDAVVCPATTCGPDAYLAQVNGQCCPACTDNSTDPTTELNRSTTRGCSLANQFHIAGTSWHPYVPPNGFDTCVVCTCHVASLETRCQRTQCPPLKCAESQAVRPDHKACCKQCPPQPPQPVTKTQLTDSEGKPPQDQGTPPVKKTPEQVLAEGGCKYPLGGPYVNGHEWHPQIGAGQEKCVKCRCKDGKVNCERKRCSRSVCMEVYARRRAAASAVMASDVNSPASAAAAASAATAAASAIDECCAIQCRRRRHQKSRHVES